MNPNNLRPVKSKIEESLGYKSTSACLAIWSLEGTSRLPDVSQQDNYRHCAGGETSRAVMGSKTIQNRILVIA
jgi:hypothetical protein